MIRFIRVKVKPRKKRHIVHKVAFNNSLDLVSKQKLLVFSVDNQNVNLPNIVYDY